MKKILLLIIAFIALFGSLNLFDALQRSSNYKDMCLFYLNRDESSKNTEDADYLQNPAQWREDNGYSSPKEHFIRLDMMQARHYCNKI